MDTHNQNDRGGSRELPKWIAELRTLYESHAANQFLLSGNVNDTFVIGEGPAARLGSLIEYLDEALLSPFAVVITYDLGQGLVVKRGQQHLSEWLQSEGLPELPSSPHQAIKFLTTYFRYEVNLSRLGKPSRHIACFLTDAQLITPALPYSADHALSSLALMLREWSRDTALRSYPLATFLITENVSDIHPLVAFTPTISRIQIPLPPLPEIQSALAVLSERNRRALPSDGPPHSTIAAQLAGTSLSAIQSLVKVKDHAGEALKLDDLVDLKKAAVERECNGLIDFIEPSRTLEDLYGQEKLKAWLRQDIELWKRNELQAMPMGYLICGPVGTGKTFMVECLAGEAGVPVVKLKNFRDKWVGSSEGNLEKIFRLLHALGRVIVFIDEADQALGRRNAGDGDSGVSGRLYSMMAEEMSNTRNRGSILWVLTSSRPDLIEVDLKRPGRIDVKIPLFPTTTAEESKTLILALCRRRGLPLVESDFPSEGVEIPLLLTPGAAEALSVKIFRLWKTSAKDPAEVLKECLTDYQHPVPMDVMRFQIDLAVREATDIEFVPAVFRASRAGSPAGVV